jgi:hypothetical protein
VRVGLTTGAKSPWDGDPNAHIKLVEDPVRSFVVIMKGRRI